MWQGARSGTSTPKEETKSVTALKQILNEKETKILQLETEIVRVSTAQFQHATTISHFAILWILS